MKDNFAAAYFVLVLLAPSSAFAYLDDGMCGVILQSIFGAFAAAAVVWLLYWHLSTRPV